jgi:pimeloyl-ACP methyl ester carboxylesterase
MAADTAAFLDTLHTGPAHVVGWSDGATVALHLALSRPDLVRRLVLIGAAVTREGITPAAEALTWGPRAEHELTAMMRPQYEPLSPDGPDHFPVVLGKLLTMWRTQAEIGIAALGGVTAPTLVMIGDDDGVRVEHAAAMARALPDAQLAVVPGTSHAVPLEKPALVTQLLVDVLGDEAPRKLMPLGATAG